jgi:acetyltransferase-like isoleucine patch superfamily enzyme/coenzyme F420-reducing hydrogenase beta subunit
MAKNRVHEFKVWEIETLTSCDGCGACEDVCPAPENAISFETDNEGFWYPQIDHDKCTNCGLCDWVCPELNADKIKAERANYDIPICYAAYNKNLETRFDSTSGGIFSVLANQTYSQGGYVGGAIYNDDYSVSHILTNDKSDLVKLRSSKYAQSDCQGLYKEAKRLLKQGEKVLVCGCPCQTAALKRYVRKDYENLILVDFICLGINSPKVWRKYLDWLESEHSSKLKYVKAKNKELGWRNLSYRFEFESGKSIYESKGKSLFTKGYIKSKAYIRPCCYDCKFRGFPRPADITLSDFWGIQNVDKTLDHDLGTSAVLINSKKGMDYFEGIKQNIVSLEVPLEAILPSNKALVESLPKPDIDRHEFFKDLDLKDFQAIASQYFPPQKRSYKAGLNYVYRGVLEIIKTTSLRPISIYQLFNINYFKKAISTSPIAGKLLIPAPNARIEIRKGAVVNVSGRFHFGVRKFKRSKLESRLLVEQGAKLDIKGSATIGYGSDIKVFTGAELVINDGCASDMNTTIICGEKIVLGAGVIIESNVTIRDYNGDHYVSLPGYKPSIPIIIGDHVSLGSECTIMPGAKIGDGAMVSPGAMVIGNVPARSLVDGSPAKVINTNISWKSKNTF